MVSVNRLEGLFDCRLHFDMGELYNAVFNNPMFFLSYNKTVFSALKNTALLFLCASGAGKQGRMNCVLSVIMFILPTLAPSFYLPRTTAHWTCAGLSFIKCIELLIRDDGGQIQ